MIWGNNVNMAENCGSDGVEYYDHVLIMRFTAQDWQIVIIGPFYGSGS